MASLDINSQDSGWGQDSGASYTGHWFKTTDVGYESIWAGGEGGYEIRAFFDFPLTDGALSGATITDAVLKRKPKFTGK